MNAAFRSPLVFPMFVMRGMIGAVASNRFLMFQQRVANRDEHRQLVRAKRNLVTQVNFAFDPLNLFAERDHRSLPLPFLPTRTGFRVISAALPTSSLVRLARLIREPPPRCR